MKYHCLLHLLMLYFLSHELNASWHPQKRREPSKCIKTPKTNSLIVLPFETWPMKLPPMQSTNPKEVATPKIVVKTANTSIALPIGP